MLVSGQNALRTYRRNWPIVPSLADPVRPIRQVVALEHFEKDLAIYLDAHPGYLDCGTDPVADGNMESPGVASWSQIFCIRTKELLPRPGSLGIRSLKMAFDGVNINGFSNGSAIASASVFWFRGWAFSNTAAIPRLSDGTLVHWNGVAGIGWQYFSVVSTTSPAAVVAQLVALNMGAGDFVLWDDLLFTPLNVTTWNDRTRRGGRNPTQAVAASRPKRVVGGLPSSRDSIYYDGNAQRLKAPAFTLNQTESVNVVFRHAFQATGRYLLDGNAGDSMAMYRPTGLARLDAYASANLAGPAIVTATWYGWTSVFNGAASSSRQGIGAETAGNVGASNAGGFTLGSVGGGGSYWVGDISSVVVLERLASPSEVINLNAAAMRRACI